MAGDTINLSDFMTFLLHDIITATPLFSHIDMNRVLVCSAYNKKVTGGGIFAKVVPLRFENGVTVKKFRNHWYAFPKIMNNGFEILYIVYFYIPRYFDLPAYEKLNVAFHELYHINPEFNGDVRRMGAYKFSHGYSKEHFNNQFKDELSHYYNKVKNTPLYAILEMNFAQIAEHFETVYTRNMKVPRPKKN
jgi:predicted metallopeptidase